LFVQDHEIELSDGETLGMLLETFTAEDLGPNRFFDS
jgi:hypothetical protein